MRSVSEIVSALTDEQRTLLSDLVVHGYWGDCDMEFGDPDGEYGTFSCDGYITDDAYMGGHFVRRGLSNRFRSLYKALGMKGNGMHRMCDEFAWAHDWWGDGRGSVFFVRGEISAELEEWATGFGKNSGT